MYLHLGVHIFAHFQVLQDHNYICTKLYSFTFAQNYPGESLLLHSIKNG